MSVEALRQWAIAQALPLWADAGFDAATGQFVERIAHDGTPLVDAPRRVMVQARQIFVFGLAYESGWFAGGDRLVETAYRQMLARYDGAAYGWAFCTDRDGRIVDPTRDLYAQAFVLLALATIRRLGGGDAPLRLARETLAFMDSTMSAAAGGYQETLPIPRTPRRQNPHMHLLEALLAWHQLLPDEGFDARAGSVMDLLEQRFVIRRSETTALVEYFDDDWAPQGGPDYGFEPGHHFEWVWLIAECERLTGRGSAVIAKALWSAAHQHGFRTDGAIFDEVTTSGKPRGAGVRLWPLTEAIKASCIGLPTPKDRAPRDAETHAKTLIDNFLRPAMPGLWYDHFDPDGHLTHQFAPASSLYHLCCAIDVATKSPWRQLR